MERCPLCGSAMAYRFNADYARSSWASTYAYFCVVHVEHVVADLRTPVSAI